VPHIYTIYGSRSIGGTFKIDLNIRISKEIKEKINLKLSG